MKIFRFILSSIFNVLFTTADPHLFGSYKRRRDKRRLANEFKDMAKETQAEIDVLKTQNPFEGAAAKSAMTTSARKSKQYATRFSNMMGGQASPEAMIAAQGATQAAVAGTAGQIAVGSEALKANKIASLRGRKTGQMGQYGQTLQSSIDERGSGWTAFFEQALPAAMSVSEGLGGGAAGAAGGGGGGAAGAASGGGGLASLLSVISDVRMKENIHPIGELQGRKMYKYNYKGDDAVHIGVLAHEIEDVNPDMVVKIDDVTRVYYDKVFKSVD